MMIQLCNGHFPSDRSEGPSAASHAVFKLGFTAEERFFGENLSDKSYAGAPGRGLLAALLPCGAGAVFSLRSANWGCAWALV